MPHIGINLRHDNVSKPKLVTLRTFPTLVMVKYCGQMQSVNLFFVFL